MKRIIRLTESDLHNIIKESVSKLLREDVLGDDWRETESPYNNYEPFEDQLDGVEDNHDWGTQGEENFDPTEYDPEVYMEYDDHDPSDNELYNYGHF